jgi:hypothetical protein
MNVNDAIAENEGEDVVEAVLDHEVEDGALNFGVAWDDGSTTTQPLDDFVDTDGTVNIKVIEYAKLYGLDLQPYVDLVVHIMNGRRDSYHDSGNEDGM